MKYPPSFPSLVHHRWPLSVLLLSTACDPGDPQPFEPEPSRTDPSVAERAPVDATTRLHADGVFTVTLADRASGRVLGTLRHEPGRHLVWDLLEHGAGELDPDRLVVPVTPRWAEQQLLHLYGVVTSGDEPDGAGPIDAMAAAPGTSQAGPKPDSAGGVGGAAETLDSATLPPAHLDACLADPRLCFADRYCPGCCNNSCTDTTCGQPNGCGATCVDGTGCHRPPLGEVTSLLGSTFTGWTCDLDMPAAHVHVLLVADTEFGPVTIDNMQADLPTAGQTTSANVASVCGDAARGFSFALPAGSWQGVPIYAVAVNEGPGQSSASISLPRIDSSQTEFVLCPPGDCQVTVYPSDDAHVRMAFPNNNYGQQNKLLAKTWDQGDGKVLLMRFVVDQLHGTLSSATWRMKSRGQDSLQVGHYWVNDVVQTWAENDVTWQVIQPIIDAGQNGWYGTWDVPANTWSTVDVGGALSQGNGTYVFGAAASNHGDFHSKEAASQANRPRLELSYLGDQFPDPSPPPPPEFPDPPSDDSPECKSLGDVCGMGGAGGKK